jgi:hypothetical protein
MRRLYGPARRPYRERSRGAYAHRPTSNSIGATMPPPRTAAACVLRTDEG